MEVGWERGMEVEVGRVRGNRGMETEGMEKGRGGERKGVEYTCNVLDKY